MLDRFRRQGFTIAKEDEEPPKWGPECTPFVMAFQELHETRQIGANGLQPIALVEIESWLRLNGWSERSMCSSIVRVVRVLDRTVIAHANKRATEMTEDAKQRQGPQKR